jgi:cytochrome c-type biogenesis protein CcmF
MAELGTFTVVLALVAALGATAAAALGHRRRSAVLVHRAELGLRAAAASLTVGSALLVTLFLSRDFSVRYVAEYSDRLLPTRYTVAAFWAGQDGSLLLWAWLLAVATVVVLHQHRDRYRELRPIVVLTLALVLVLFTGLVATLSNPFTRLPFVPEDGAGLNAMLQNWGQLYHPPALFLGYVGFTIPFAYSIAALVTGRLDTEWVRAVRVWMVGSWLFLGLGILLGARWAYTELGWGGYWAWDPVENVSLLPWLTATAYLHSVVLQERRGTLRVSNLVLAVTTFVLTLFGTFLVRSGVASSVHAFAESSAGTYLLGAIVVTVIATALLITWRLPELRRPPARPEHPDGRGEHADGRDGPSGRRTPWSRERLVVLTNALLIAFTLAVFWGTLFPVLSSTVQGREVTVGAGFYDLVSLPFTLALLLLTGLCPVVAWRRASARGLRRQLVLPLAVGLGAGTLAAVLDRGRHPVTIAVLSLAAFAATTLLAELHRGVHAHGHDRVRDHLPALKQLFVRSPRRYGGLVVHLGVVLLIVGVALDVTYRSDERHTLRVGEGVEVGGYVLTLVGLDTEMSAARVTLAATLDVTRTSGRDAGTVVTERYLGANQEQPRTHVGVRSLLREDIYVILEDVDVESETAGIHVHLHPGVLWIWVGGGLLLLGGLLAIWPFRRTTTAPRTAPPGDAAGAPVAAAVTAAPAAASMPGDDLEARIARRRELMTRGEAER